MNLRPFLAARFACPAGVFRLSAALLIVAIFGWPEAGLAHERWILSPTEVLEWNAKPKPETYTRVGAANVTILGLAFLFTLGWVRLGSTGAREMFQDLVARLTSYGDYAAVILRFCLAWAMISSAFALEPRVGNAVLASPTLLAPDLEIAQIDPAWQWVREFQIVLGLMFLLGIYVRLAAFALIVAVFLAYWLFGAALNDTFIDGLIHNPVHAYSLSVWGVAIYLLMQGPGSHYLPLPTPGPFRRLADWLADQPRQRAQFILRWAAGLNFFILGIWFKVLQPNLALGIIVTYQVPILHLAPETFVLVMAVIEVLAGVFLFLGILMRPISLFLLAAMLFFALMLPESLTAHIIAYGIMLTFLFNGAGHWRRPEATDKPAHIVILGGGYSALTAARRLEQLRGAYTNIQVTLVHPSAEFVFAPLLPEVVGGSVQPGNVVNPILRILDTTRVIQGRLIRLDPDARRIELTRQSGETMSLVYDELILAMESVPRFDGIPGLADEGAPLDSVGDALHLRASVIYRLAEAEQLPPGDARRRLLGFCVVGGGQRGSATALEIRTLLKVAALSYPGLSPDEFDVSLFEDPQAPEEHLPEALRPLRNRMLERHGVRLMPEALPEAITPDGVVRADGERLPCATVVNARYRPARLDHPVSDEGGPASTDGNLALEQAAHIWVASNLDNRCINRFVTLAEQRRRGKAAAYNAYAATQGFTARAFRPPRAAIQVVHMGGASVASFLGMGLAGFPAWLLSRIQSMAALPGLERNLRVVMDWLLDIPFRNDIAILAPERTERLTQAYYQAGDTVIREGEKGSTAYLIRQGRVRVSAANEVLGTLESGDCFGEIALLSDSPRTATVTCDTACEFTILTREQFTDLTTGFRELGDALKRQAERRAHASANEPGSAPVDTP